MSLPLAPQHPLPVVVPQPARWQHNWGSQACCPPGPIQGSALHLRLSLGSLGV